MRYVWPTRTHLFYFALEIYNTVITCVHMDEVGLLQHRKDGCSILVTVKACSYPYLPCLVVQKAAFKTVPMRQISHDLLQRLIVEYELTGFPRRV